MEGLKIIIADDEALIRLDLREMLTEAGIRCLAKHLTAKKPWSLPGA